MDKKDFPCPCHSGKSYSACCQRYHNGLLAENALALMRSRYAAYALHLADYIMRTTHPANPGYYSDATRWKKEILNSYQSTQFYGLQIIDFIDGKKEAFVTFTALLKNNGHDTSFTEKSRFLKMDGQWLYESGVFFKKP